MDSVEVGSAAWISRQIAKQALTLDPSQDSFSGVKFQDGKWIQATFSVTGLKRNKDEKGFYLDEHLSTGSSYAIQEWLRKTASDSQESH